MKNYIIFDLEATCWKDDRIKRNETIEIGAVKINENYEVVGTFETFVKPILNPILSDFCKELTSIKQEEVDDARTFMEVVEEFKKWISEDHFILCSWGHYDKKQILNDSEIHNIDDVAWTKKHISLKHQFAQIKNIKPCGMQKALSILNIALEGTHHRGIYDAKNISKIFIKCFKDWKFE